MPAKSDKQRRFFGMVRAVQKGEMDNPDERLRRVAKSISVQDARDFAKKTEKKAHTMTHAGINHLTKQAGMIAGLARQARNAAVGASRGADGVVRSKGGLRVPEAVAGSFGVDPKATSINPMDPAQNPRLAAVNARRDALLSKIKGNQVSQQPAARPSFATPAATPAAASTQRPSLASRLGSHVNRNLPTYIAGLGAGAGAAGVGALGYFNSAPSSSPSPVSAPSPAAPSPVAQPESPAPAADVSSMLPSVTPQYDDGITQAFQASNDPDAQRELAFMLNMAYRQPGGDPEADEYIRRMGYRPADTTLPNLAASNPYARYQTTQIAQR